MPWLLLSIFLLQPAPDDNARAREAFYAALRAAQEGHAEEAARALEKIAQDHPESPYAADSLSKAASIYEEELFLPQQALRLYKTLVEKYPESRPASRARARAEFIASHLGRGPQVLGEYLKIQRTATADTARQSAEAMLELLEKNPGFSLEAEGKLWAASLFGRAGLKEKAHKLLWQIAEGNDKSKAAQALIELANQALAENRPLEARRAYLRLSELDPRWRGSAETGLLQVKRQLVKIYLPWLSLVLYLACLIWLWVALFYELPRKSFRPRGLPVEVWIYLAACLPIMVLSVFGSRHTTRSIFLLALLVLLLILPNAWWWRLGPRPSYGKISARLIGLTLGVFAAGVVAITLGGYYPELWHTIEFGPE